MLATFFIFKKVSFMNMATEKKILYKLWMVVCKTHGLLTSEYPCILIKYSANLKYFLIKEALENISSQSGKKNIKYFLFYLIFFKMG